MNERLFCPDHQDKLPQSLRGLDISVFESLREQVTDALEHERGAPLLNEMQRAFLVDYVRAFKTIQDIDGEFPRKAKSRKLLGAALHILRSSTELTITEENQNLVDILSADPSIVEIADALQRSFRQVFATPLETK